METNRKKNAMLNCFVILKLPIYGLLFSAQGEKLVDERTIFI